MRPRGGPRGCSVRAEPGPLPRLGASMRPRGGPRGCGTHGNPHAPALIASMRPRGGPRGCALLEDSKCLLLLASMRPRGGPRGCLRSPTRRTTLHSCFNEATGRTPWMRQHHRGGQNLALGFNEATGRTPWMPSTSAWAPSRACSFNEATGRTPWMPDGARVGLGEGRLASMRPRGGPRGCLTCILVVDERDRASMRPRGGPRGCGPRANHCARTACHGHCERCGVAFGMTAEAAPRSAVFRGDNYPVVKDLRALRALPGVAAAPKRSIHGGGHGRHTITGSRRTAWNVFPRLTTRGSMPSATPTSTRTTWSAS